MNFSIESITQPIQNFINQSLRVLNVTHKPGPEEFKKIAYITALGMIVIGITGFTISMIAYFLGNGI